MGEKDWMLISLPASPAASALWCVGPWLEAAL